MLKTLNLLLKNYSEQVTYNKDKLINNLQKLKKIVFWLTNDYLTNSKTQKT